MTVHMIQRVGVVSEGLGRDRLDAVLLPDYGYFTSPHEAATTLFRLNEPARKEYERQEEARRERYRATGAPYLRMPMRNYDRIPQFSLRPIGSGVEIESTLLARQAEQQAASKRLELEA